MKRHSYTHHRQGPFSCCRCILTSSQENCDPGEIEEAAGVRVCVHLCLDHCGITAEPAVLTKKPKPVTTAIPQLPGRQKAFNQMGAAEVLLSVVNLVYLALS